MFIRAVVVFFLAAAFADTHSLIYITNSRQESIPFYVELAITPQAQTKGLMYRDFLPKQHGMLFIEQSPRHVSFWMKNTYIPLDLIFIDENQKIVEINTRFDVLSKTNTESRQPIKYVLEINAGEAKALNLSRGDRVDISQLK